MDQVAEILRLTSFRRCSRLDDAQLFGDLDVLMQEPTLRVCIRLLSQPSRSHACRCGSREGAATVGLTPATREGFRAEAPGSSRRARGA